MAPAPVPVGADLWMLTVQHSPIGMVLVGLDGRLLLANRALCDMLGYSADELTTHGFQELTHPEDLEADLALFEQTLDGEIDSYRIRKRYLHADGRVVWGDLSVALVRDVEGAPLHFISQILDVSEQRAYEELQEEFISSVSHELRTPLASVMGYLELLCDEEDMPARMASQLSIIQRNAARLRALLTDLLQVSQARDGGLRLECRQCDLVSIAREAVQAAAPEAALAEVGVELDAPILLRVSADERRIRQVLDNLISNAIKYTDPRGTVHVGLQRLEESVEVTVTDTGVGIPAHEAERIFDRFFRGTKALGRRVPGTGLGLTIVRSIVEDHGGSIAFDSEPGRGTTVTVELPDRATRT